ncbi:MAG: hypothetical protein R3C30_07145 [Hyphomonadaceae bacterium]
MTIATTFRAFLDQAHASLNESEAQESERCAKAVSALVRAERDVAEYLNELRAAADNDDYDTMRAELQRRLSIFADAARSGHSVEVLARIAATGAAG